MVGAAVKTVAEKSFILTAGLSPVSTIQIDGLNPLGRVFLTWQSPLGITWRLNIVWCRLSQPHPHDSHSLN